MSLKTVLIMECSRIFSLPMSVMSWFVIFVYASVSSGNLSYGVLSLIGICFAHLGTNIIDDYIDYKTLIKQVDFDKEEYLKNSQKTKCRYLISGRLKEIDILFLCALYFGIALLIGIVLFIKCGFGVLYFALAGGVIALLYPFLSKICLSEITVALAYGPALFGGVYYVMTGAYSKEVFVLCIPTMIMTVVLLYIHTIMDYEFDLNEAHWTIANRFDSQLESLVVLRFLLISAYLSIIFLCILDILDWQAFLTYITIPLAVDLYKSLKEYSCNPDSIPEHKWYHLPMENIKFFEQRGEASFMIRMYQSRNLMIYFSLLLVFGMILSLAI